MPDFVQLAVRPNRLLLGKIVLLPLVLGYKAKLVSGVVIRAAICFFGFWRVPAHELETYGHRFSKEFLPTTLRPEAMSRIAWHKARGDTIVVVSGGLNVYLSHWCREQGVELLCSDLEQRGGRLTGRYLGRQCVGQEKARLVQENFPPTAYGRIFAYGDTPEDRELLALAHEPYYRWQRASVGGR